MSRVPIYDFTTQELHETAQMLGKVPIKQQSKTEHLIVRTPSRWNFLVEGINNFNRLSRANPSLGKKLIEELTNGK